MTNWNHLILGKQFDGFIRERQNRIVPKNIHLGEKKKKKKKIADMNVIALLR